jgi:hypothetical protein
MPTTQLLGVTLEGARTVVAGALAHARGKANGALNLGVGCRSLAARAAAHPAFINSVVALTDGGLVPAAGGVLVRDDGDDVIGAVEVSGSLPDDDEACAVPASPPRGHAPTSEPDPTIPRIDRSTTHERIPSQRWHVAHSAG